MKNVAVVAFSQAPSVRCEPNKVDVEMVAPVISDVFKQAGLARDKVGFICSGSTDYLSGIPFSFAHALDAAAPWPPMPESHVEMDGAWAFYEAWVKLQTGQAEVALIYSFGKSSTPDELVDVFNFQMDPYTIAPLGIDSISLAALQAQSVLDAGKYTERDFAQVAIDNRKAAKQNVYAQVKGDFQLEDILAAPYIASPLRKHDCPPISDGAAAMLIATQEVAEQVCERPAWIRGVDHRIDAHQPGVRDLTQSPSTTLATEMAGVHRDKIDVVELYAPFTHQELILRDAMGLSEEVNRNPSGGALGAHPIMSAGLIRIGEVASRIWEGRVDRGVAHATSGSCLQQNLVAVLEGK